MEKFMLMRWNAVLLIQKIIRREFFDTQNFNVRWNWVKLIKDVVTWISFIIFVVPIF